MSRKLSAAMMGKHSKLESLVGRTSQSAFVGRVLVGITDRRDCFHSHAHQGAATGPGGFSAPVQVQGKRVRRTGIVMVGDVCFVRYT